LAPGILAMPHIPLLMTNTGWYFKGSSRES
jgi:hypothetical protein